MLFKTYFVAAALVAITAVIALPINNLEVRGSGDLEARGAVCPGCIKDTTTNADDIALVKVKKARKPTGFEIDPAPPAPSRYARSFDDDDLEARGQACPGCIKDNTTNADDIALVKVKKVKKPTGFEIDPAPPAPSRHARSFDDDDNEGFELELRELEEEMLSARTFGEEYDLEVRVEDNKANSKNDNNKNDNDKGKSSNDYSKNDNSKGDNGKNDKSNNEYSKNDNPKHKHRRSFDEDEPDFKVDLD